MLILQDIQKIRERVAAVEGRISEVRGREPTDLVEKWLLEIFGKDSFTPLFAVEWTNRVLTHPLPACSPPRPLLIRIISTEKLYYALLRVNKTSTIIISYFTLLLLLKRSPNWGPLYFFVNAPDDQCT